ncbi:MAG: nitroreductase family protein [Microbacteriaceae bacterium]
MSSYRSLLRRQSASRVGRSAPSRKKVLKYIAAASRAADHGGLEPWRFIEIRGKARQELGEAIATAAELKGMAFAKMVAKPFRAPLLIAIVAVRNPAREKKIPYWEQDAAAAGAAHYLSLLLDEAGWGVMWRTGQHVRKEPVRIFHHLEDNEELLGWLYVGNRTKQIKKPRGPHPSPELLLTTFD